MSNYRIKMTRVYETIFEFDATSQQDAWNQFEALENEKYAVELEQCCVTEEKVDFDFSSDLPEGEKFARKCDATGEPMNEGWCIGDGEYYAKYEKDVLIELSKRGYASLSSAYEDDVCYWTEWEDEDDYQYVVKDGKLVEIE